MKGSMIMAPDGEIISVGGSVVPSRPHDVGVIGDVTQPHRHYDGEREKERESLCACFCQCRCLPLLSYISCGCPVLTSMSMYTCPCSTRVLCVQLRLSVCLQPT